MEQSNIFWSSCYWSFRNILNGIIFFLIYSASAQTPIQQHGALSVSGNKIVDQNNQPFSVAGNSFFWSNTGWGSEPFYNAQVVNWLKNDWNSYIVRASMGVEEGGGYLSDPSGNLNRVTTLVDAAIAEGLYVIIDWHTHHAEDNQSAAISFFQDMANQYGNNPNVIYEIYNEPLPSSWSNSVKPYSEAVISAIRAIDPDNLIVVGSPTWSQDVDVASQDPITGFANIAYSLHFYAGTHGQSLRNKITTALNNGIAIMVTEWGAVNADGNGAVATGSVNEWMNFLEQNQLTHLNWAVNDKAEGASVVVPGSSPTGGWSSNVLTASGTLVRQIMLDWNEGGAGGNIPPSVSLTSPANGASFEEGDNVSISANASDPDGSVVSVGFYANGNLIGSDNSAPYSISWNNVSSGNYVLTAVATDNNNATTTSSSRSISVGNTSGPCDGPYTDIPGLIQAEDFCDMQGIQTENTSDTGGGINVGWIDIGDWLEYTIDVPESGNYNLDYRVASISGNGEMQFQVNGNVLSTEDIPNTGGWQNWTTISTTVNLTAGDQVIRLYASGAPYNINWFELSEETGGGNVSPTIAITSPSNGSVFEEGDNVTINASASDSDGDVVSVQFYANGNLLGTDTSSPFSFSWNSIGSGNYSLTAIATDNDNATGISNSVSVTVEGINSGSPCSNPTSVSLPFAQDGAGDFCFEISGNINFINSWNMALVEINGVDFTNSWSNSMPPRIDGSYFVRYVGNFPWSHFEASGSNTNFQINPSVNARDSKFDQFTIFPNPSQSSVVISGISNVRKIQVISMNGQVLFSKKLEGITHEMTMDTKEYENGLYLIRFWTEDEGMQVKKLRIDK